MSERSRNCKGCDQPCEPIKYMNKGSERTRYNTFCATCREDGKHLRRKESAAACRSRNSLRGYLLRTRGHSCARCGFSEWRGKPIPLEVEHHDGDCKNNAEENVDLLCPNCHALTGTWKGRSKYKGTRQVERRLN